MNHRKISIILIVAGTIACLGVLWVFAVYFPIIAIECKQSFPKLAWMYWPALIYVWLIGLIYLVAIAQYLSISKRIGKNRSFCRENVRDLWRIGLLFLSAAILWLLSLASVLLPGMAGGPWCIISVLFAMASGALGLLAWALKSLLQRATRLQEENDLTI